MASDFPAQVEQFIVQYIESLAQLEGLLLMRQDRQRSWDAEELAKALYTSPETCATLLAELEQRGLLVLADPQRRQYRYQPADPNVDQLVGDLAAIYQERRVAVITLIYSKPVSKVQTFADSFRLRRDK
jgi:hypothetical protein